MSLRRATHKDEQDIYKAYRAGFENLKGGMHPSFIFCHPFRHRYPEDWEQAHRDVVTTRLNLDSSYGYNMIVEADGKAVAWALWRRNFDDAKKVDLLTQPTKTPNRAFSKSRAEFLRALDKEDWFQGEHWYLSMLVVHPDYRRHGYGRLLTAWGQDRAREDGVYAGLTSTPEGEKLYRSMGFEELGLYKSPWDSDIKVDLEEGEEKVDFFPTRAFKWGKDPTGRFYGKEA